MVAFRGKTGNRKGRKLSCRTKPAKRPPHPRWPTEKVWESPRCRRASSPEILPCRRRAHLELSEAIRALYAYGMSTPAISRFLEGLHGAFYSPQSISRLSKVVKEEGRAWRERPLDEEYYAVFLDGTFLSVRRGKRA